MNSLEASHNSPLPVLSLLEDDTPLAVKDIIVNLFSLSRQAVHKLPIGLRAGLGTKLFGDLVAVERLKPRLLFGFLTHRDPIRARVRIRG